MKKVFIDAGHGGNDPGASGYGLKEKDITLAIARQTKNYLDKMFSGVDVKVSRMKDRSVTLKERTNAANAWGANLLVSIHVNAGGGRGFESYMYNGAFKGKEKTREIQKVLHEAILTETGFVNRGMKEQNFHMVRASQMPAVLTENGFIDRKEDAVLLKSAAFLNKIAKGHAVGIAEILRLPKRQGIVSQVMYRVVTGSFENYAYAKEQVQLLAKKDIEAFIDPHTSREKMYYRVVTGSFQELANAKKRMSILESYGFDSFIVNV